MVGSLAQYKWIYTASKYEIDRTLDMLNRQQISHQKSPGVVLECNNHCPKGGNYSKGRLSIAANALFAPAPQPVQALPNQQTSNGMPGHRIHTRDSTPLSAWAFENDNKGYTPILDMEVNNLLTNTLKESTANPTKPTRCTYMSNGFSYSADLHDFVQTNMATGTTRRLRPPGTRFMPNSARLRDVPSFRRGLSSKVMLAVAEVAQNEQNIKDCLWKYQRDYQLARGHLDDFEYKLHNGTPMAICVVWLYTVECWVYHHVNNSLRAEDEGKIRKLGPYIKALMCAIHNVHSDFTALNGPPKTLHRRMDLKPVDLAQYKTGEAFVWNSFTSTSCYAPPEHFGPTLFQIELNETAVSETLFLEPFTAVPGEYEVLIPAGAFFKVVSHEDNLVVLRMFAGPSVF
eukprot:TRINITY_DN47263_c0_g1_i1.p2 TRINITY_DN47263_c0_g1~~TRINITY_DN47263_c0_g1_i1.p2  ORF type:complete len:401 (+),score=58.56 TRINITY_DN47263_c0_g1_i1:880-2082(+)